VADGWLPEPIWKDEPCYVVGGGSSLENFPWESLRGQNVIGCNAAFYIGADIVPVMLFGDGAFLKRHRSGLDKYAADGGMVITCSQAAIDRFDPPAYLKRMARGQEGLAVDGLGWNRNTGAAAINLALLFGASMVYLLGFDMQLIDGKKNFHNAYNDTPNAQAYERFNRGMNHVVRDLARLFSGRKVINLEDGTSVLNVFPKMSLKSHLADLKEVVA